MSSACGELPFCLGRQPLARPLAVGERVFISDMHYRMIPPSLQVAARAFGMSPVRARSPLPPLRVVAERYGVVGRQEHKRSGYKNTAVRRRCAGRELLL